MNHDLSVSFLILCRSWVILNCANATKGRKSMSTLEVRTHSPNAPLRFAFSSKKNHKKNHKFFSNFFLAIYLPHPI
jgi:hypothetical protein